MKPRSLVAIAATLACVSIASADDSRGPFDLTPQDRAKAFFQRLDGQNVDPEAVARQRNATYHFLVRKGIDPETAKAAVLNPVIMEHVMRQIGAKR